MRALRALPTLLRIGVAETVAYRGEFIVWMLTTTMPLVMLALWTAVARETPIPGFGAGELTSYYLATLIVRQLTGNWIVWELNYEIRLGTLSMRLLRPLHPLWQYAGQHMSAVPMRALVSAPIVALTMAIVGTGAFTHDPVLLGAFALSVALAWALNFLAMSLLGLLALYTEQSLSAFDVFFGIFGVMSGYLIPLELLPGWVRAVASWLPFRGMLGLPVELACGRLGHAEAASAIALQAGWVALMLVATLGTWRRALRRFEALGG